MGITTIPLVIGGQTLSEGSEGVGESINPATGAVLANYAKAGEREVNAAVSAARQAFDTGPWGRMRPHERGRILHRIGELMLERRDEIARLESQDSGKPMRDAYWEVDCSARFFEYYAGAADKLHGTSIPIGPGWTDWTVQEGIGVSLHIIPWNYPFQLIARGVAPALAAGCSVIIKPASETPVTAYEFVKICQEAGLPDGQVNLVNGRGSTVGDMLARHPGVDQITFTGSVPTGRRVQEAAASHAIPTNMELGGKSPQILFSDADMDSAIPIVAGGVFLHCGQVCNAGTRLLVERSSHDAVVDKLHAHIKNMQLGAGIDDPDMGPLVSKAHKEDVTGYYEVAGQDGELLLGAELPTDPSLSDGAFVRPALVVGASNETRIAREEIFGPILTVIPFDTAEEAAQIANDSPFGLVAGVHTTNLDKAMNMSQQLRVGQVWINSFGVGLDVEFPFGGYKLSGFGREKGLEAIGAYQQTKNVCIRHTR
ncbi:aldehyde dehydrogenase family protein [Pseudohoeflea coraliihabitans]|uniref:Aldehyde dehydrogenase family protein n=1 Tax=Pseudohoeflea coraliihabitans TaxID=2860393 RepID=A0ABS6WIU6_9HYPH|nr:aldehyde dehydrogenase family protein [Pseudohoeflea sp. DP4N28-3]MBW3095854.1 aldehyde dehydrogenase family protein [Pseudohoeflea sp. DP4N28-3]